jgi:hypothetical protein
MRTLFSQLMPLRRTGAVGAAVLLSAFVFQACASGSSTSDAPDPDPTVEGGGGDAGTSAGGAGGSTAGKGGSSTAGKGGSTTGGAGQSGAGTSGEGGTSGAGGSGFPTTGGASGGGGEGGEGGSTGGSSGGGGEGGSAAGKGGAAGVGGTGPGGAAGKAGGGGVAGVGGSSGAPAGGTGGQVACADQKEICDGLDNNCNGTIDEGNPGGGEPCAVDGAKGECAKGVTECKKGKLTCTQKVTAQPEVCDGLDNDCDGQVDKGSVFADDTNKPCKTDQKGLCSAGTNQCTDGKLACVQNVQPTAEVCNGFDDNCDGVVDEGSPGAGMDCVVAGQNPNTPCAKGVTTCGPDGQNICKQVVMPTAELCDGIDNDCNGTIDDPGSVVGQACDTGLMGACKDGKSTCSQGKGGCIATITPGSIKEVCDGLDNDCDGTVDNDADPNNDNSLCSPKYPTASFVQTWACTNGNCEINSCQPSHADIDTSIANGCECSGEIYPSACAGAKGLSIPFNSTVPQSGIISSSSGEAWFHIQFSGFPSANNDPGTIHFQVALTGGSSEFAMDAYNACGTPVACGVPGATTQDGNPTNLSLWEYKAVHAADCPLATSCSNASPPPSDMYIVIRRTNGAASCNPYTFEARNLNQ